MAPNANLPILKKLDVLRSTWSLAAGEVVTEATLLSRACRYSARRSTPLWVVMEAALLSRAHCRSVRHSAILSFVKEVALPSRACWYSARHTFSCASPQLWSAVMAALSGETLKKVIRCANRQDLESGGIVANGANMKNARRNPLASPQMLAAVDRILQVAPRPSVTSGEATRILEKAIACTGLQSMLLAPPAAHSRARERTSIDCCRC